MIIIWSIHFSLLLLYTASIFRFTYGWIKAKPIRINENIQTYTSFSILIALRNEEENLPSLINCLNNLDYPNFEVILINDHSEDSTLNLLIHHATFNDNFFVIDLPENIYGKKQAINKGIEQAIGEVILTTDADCFFLPEWLQQYNYFYLTQNKPDMIVGLVDHIPSKSILPCFFRLDFLSLVVSSAGATSLKSPIFNNAANCAFKKHALNAEADSNLNLVSGDDVFRLHDFKSRNKEILLLKSKKSVVTTAPPRSIKEFVNQRVRWASKANKYTDPLSLFIAFLVFTLNCSFIVVLAMVPFTKFYLVPLSFLLTKTIVDYILFFSSLSMFSLKKELFLIPLFEVIYPFYIVYAAIMSQKKPFFWKGRLSR